MTGSAPETATWITRADAREAGPRVAVKDLFDTAGVRTTYGSAIFADHVPRRSAQAVSRLERAGYVRAGKANLHEFAFGITSQNPHFGDVPNPRFPERTPGGSSGGCAAALATGQSDLGLGTDSGGSLRIPAACCEVTAFKPSFGLVPLDGCFPLAPSFDHAGPLARDVAGCAEAMTALAGLERRLPPALGELRVGVAWAERAEPAVRERLGEVAALLPGGREIELPLPAGVFPAFQREIAEVHGELFAMHRERYGANVATKVTHALAVSDAEAERASADRERYRQIFDEALAGLDLVIAPTLPVPPPPADSDELEIRARMTELTFPANVAGAPALALPCGRSPGGLPVSTQLVARPGEDALVLAAGAALEAALRNTAAPGRSRTDERGA